MIGGDDLERRYEQRLAVQLIELDLGKLERAWNAYNRRHPRPAFSPTVEQLPHFPTGEIQIALI